MLRCYTFFKNKCFCFFRHEVETPIQITVITNRTTCSKISPKNNGPVSMQATAAERRDISGSDRRPHLVIEISAGFPLFSSGDKMRSLAKDSLRQYENYRNPPSFEKSSFCNAVLVKLRDCAIFLRYISFNVQRSRKKSMTFCWYLLLKYVFALLVLRRHPICGTSWLYSHQRQWSALQKGGQTQGFTRVSSLPSPQITYPAVAQ